MSVKIGTIAAENLGNAFENLEKTSPIAGEKRATIVVRNHARALEIEVEIESAVLSKNPEATFSPVPNVVFFFELVKRFILRKFE